MGVAARQAPEQTNAVERTNTAGAVPLTAPWVALRGSRAPSCDARLSTICSGITPSRHRALLAGPDGTDRRTRAPCSPKSSAPASTRFRVVT